MERGIPRGRCIRHFNRQSPHPIWRMPRGKSRPSASAEQGPNASTTSLIEILGEPTDSRHQHRNDRRLCRLMVPGWHRARRSPDRIDECRHPPCGVLDRTARPPDSPLRNSTYGNLARARVDAIFTNQGDLGAFAAKPRLPEETKRTRRRRLTHHNQERPRCHPANHDGIGHSPAFVSDAAASASVAIVASTNAVRPIRGQRAQISGVGRYHYQYRDRSPCFRTALICCDRCDRWLARIESFIGDMDHYVERGTFAQVSLFRGGPSD